jgi:hypothetical protein
MGRPHVARWAQNSTQTDAGASVDAVASVDAAASVDADEVGEPQATILTNKAAKRVERSIGWRGTTSNRALSRIPAQRCQIADEAG